MQHFGSAVQCKCSKMKPGRTVGRKKGEMVINFEETIPGRNGCGTPHDFLAALQQNGSKSPDHKFMTITAWFELEICYTFFSLKLEAHHIWSSKYRHVP